MLEQINYQELCRVGAQIDGLVERNLADVKRVVQNLINAEQDHPENIERYRTELAAAKQKLHRERGTLMQHVAHCSDGCKRAPGGPAAFAAENQTGVFSRSPSHAKPDLPTPRELANRIAAGDTAENLAAEYERSIATIRKVINSAGFSSTTGLPQASKAARAVLHQIIDTIPLWADQALCAQTDPDAFFPHKGGSTRDAKATCARCLVQAECLDYALANKERFGIWGGMSERDRRRLTKPKTASTGTPASSTTPQPQESA